MQKVWNQQLRVVILCSEAKPEECHRSKLIGETLIQNGIDIAHIDEKGEIKTQSKVIEILTKGQLSFLGRPSVVTKSRKKYQPDKVPND